MGRSTNLKIYARQRGMTQKDYFNAAKKFAKIVGKGYDIYKRYKKPINKRVSERKKTIKSKLTPSPDRTRKLKNVVNRTSFQGHVTSGKKRFDVDVYQQKGSLLKLERGGSVSASDLNHSVYAGYGTPMKLVTESMYRAILKKLISLAGYKIRDWTRPAGYDLYSATNIIDKAVSLRIRYQYRYASSTTTPSTLVSDYPILNLSAVYAPSTWNAIALDMDSAVAGLITTGTVEASGGNNLIIDNIALSLYTLHSGVTDSDVPMANINAQDLHLYFRVNSGMKVSNVTKAAASDGDEYSTENILANPLTGKLYTIKKWANSFVQKHQAYNDASGVVLSPTDTEPVFTTSSNVTNTQLLKKPPKYYYFDNCKHEQLVNLEPGAIKQFGTSFTCKMSLNTFINKYIGYVGLNTTQITGTSQASFGHTQLIGMECMLNNRAETSAVTSLDYELNQSIGCFCVIKRGYSQPIIDVA